MRQARLRGEGHHFTHCLSRIVQRQFIIGNTEKKTLWDIMVNQSTFAGLKIVTIAILDNHFHILLEVPDPDEIPELTVDELFTRMPAIYGEAKIKEFRKIFDEAEAMGDQDKINRLLARFAKRMHDVSFYMKEVKQRFSQWYNLRNDRRGTLWEERYKSVLVEGSQEALMTMAAYIDLNPVRAGIVDKAEGKMPRARALRCRVRYFTDGAVFGSAAYIEEVFNRNRGHFGKKRSNGARKMRGAEWGGLCVIRDLRKTVMTT